MGQYHIICNVDKKEYFGIGGAKLWEKAHSATAAAFLLLFSNSNGRGGGDFSTYPQDYDKPTDQETAEQAIIDKVSGRWAGDRIVVQGDYAEETDKAFITKDELGSYRSITTEVAEALLIADNGDNSDVVQVLESEMKHGFGGLKKDLPNIEKVKSKDRNGGDTLMYRAKGFKPKKKRKTKAEKQREEFEKQLETLKELATKQGIEVSMQDNVIQLRGAIAKAEGR